MHIKIKKVALDKGIPSAFVIHINGKKFPKGYREWYFCDNKIKAKKLAVEDWMKEQGFIDIDSDYKII